MIYCKKKTLGSLGEFMSSKILSSLGYKILDKNYHSKHGEIDLIATKSATIYFIESKLTTSSCVGSVLKKWKSRQSKSLKKTIRSFLLKNNEYAHFNIQILLIHFDFSEEGVVNLSSYTFY